MKAYKCIIIGDAHVGKTSYLRKTLGIDYDGEYIATLGIEVHPIYIKSLNTTFNCWDLSGDERYSGVFNDYLNGAQCAIIMFEENNMNSYYNMKKWFDKIKHLNIPYVVCQTKSTNYDRSIIMPHVEGMDFDIIYINSERNVNLHEPFLELYGKLHNYN